MNKKVISGMILSSIISVSACQTEKTEKVEINGKNQGPEKVLIVQEKT